MTQYLETIRYVEPSYGEIESTIPQLSQHRVVSYSKVLGCSAYSQFDSLSASLTRKGIDLLTVQQPDGFACGVLGPS